MANNKVQLANGTVLIDITDTTANASDVLSGEYFYDASGVKTEGILTIPSTYTVTKTLTNVTTSNNDTEVLVGGSFYMDLTPSSGMVINSITVTMDGIDVTEQVFKAGVDEKIITQNGIYDAEDDWLEGYSEVTVNVPNTYTSSDEGKVVSGGALVAQTSDTVTQNGTVDTTLINSLTVNVSGGSSPTGTKQISITENGTVTEDVTDYANVEITTNVSGGGSIDLSAIAQAANLNNIGGLFTAFENGTWAYQQKSFTSGTNPMTVDFGRAIKGVMYYPKSITVLSGLANNEREVLGIGIFNEEGESGSQSILWSICRKKGGTAASTAFVTRASTTLANGVLSMVPDYPSNANYHPFGFNIPYMFVYWW